MPLDNVFYDFAHLFYKPELITVNIMHPADLWIFTLHSQNKKKHHCGKTFINAAMFNDCRLFRTTLFSLVSGLIYLKIYINQN